MSSILSVRGPSKGAASAAIRVPSSKSELNRLFILAALRRGDTFIRGLSQANDVTHMIGGLKSLGVEIERVETGYQVQPFDQISLKNRSEPLALDCGSGGTTLRFLMAVAAHLPIHTFLRASDQLLKRPFAAWIDCLTRLGASVIARNDGFEIRGCSNWPSSIAVASDESSQFASAVAMASTLGSSPIMIQTAERVSEPYFEMTLYWLKVFGCTVSAGATEVTVTPPSDLDREKELNVTAEADASSAAVWLALARFGFPVQVTNYPKTSRQADTEMLRILKLFDGASHRTISLRDCPDLAPVLTAFAAQLPGDTDLVGAAHLRYKESNRIEDLAEMCSRLGVRVIPQADGLKIPGGQVPRSGKIHSHGDHRLVMSAVLFSAQGAEVQIEEPWALNKSYPEFWEDLRSAGFRIEEIS